MGRLGIRTPLVIHDTVDGQVLAVNLETGNYYSLAGTAAAIWAALERTATAAEIAVALQAAFVSADGVVEREVGRFLAELEHEGLIVAAEGEEEAAKPAPALAPAPSSQAFEPPVLETFTDMQDLILLDPVHEVDAERGWPHPGPTG